MPLSPPIRDELGMPTPFSPPIKGVWIRLAPLIGGELVRFRTFRQPIGEELKRLTTFRP
jgi:hypothetical protein